MNHSTTSTSFHLEGGSEDFVTILELCLQNILYFRHIFREDDFKWEDLDQRPEHGHDIQLPRIMLEPIQRYLNTIFQQLQVWCQQPGTIQQVVLVVRSLESRRVVERWPFFVYPHSQSIKKERSEKFKEWKALVRQIMTLSTIMPSLEKEPCTFNILVYANKQVGLPVGWSHGDAHIIRRGSHMKVRAVEAGTFKLHSRVVHQEE